MSAIKIIEIIKEIFGDVDLPVCVSIVDNEDGLTLFETKTCDKMKLSDEMTNIFGLMAFDELSKTLKNRTKRSVDMLVFRSGDLEYFIMPVSDVIFMCAVAKTGSMGKIISFLNGIAHQVIFQLEKLAKEES